MEMLHWHRQRIFVEVSLPVGRDDLTEKFRDEEEVINLFRDEQYPVFEAFLSSFHFAFLFLSSKAKMVVDTEKPFPKNIRSAAVSFTSGKLFHLASWPDLPKLHGAFD